MLRSEGSTLPLSFGASRQPKYVSLSTLLLIKSQIISLFSVTRRSFHLVIFISLQRIISRVLSLLVLLSSNFVNQLSVALTKLSLLYARLVTLFSTRLLFISLRDIEFITRAYYLSLLVFKYISTSVYSRYELAIFFIVVLFLLVVSLALSKLDYIFNYRISVRTYYYVTYYHRYQIQLWSSLFSCQTLPIVIYTCKL